MIDPGTFLAVVNPAAGGGRCRKLVGPTLDRLRAGGISLKMVETGAPGQATSLVRDAYAQCSNGNRPVQSPDCEQPASVASEP